MEGTTKRKHHGRQLRALKTERLALPTWYEIPFFDDLSQQSFPEDTRNGQTHRAPDPGDQSIWRSFYASVTELPIGYNAMKRSTFNNAAAAWDEVSILHDVDVNRGRMIPSPRVNSHYTNLTVYARLLVSAIAKELGVVDRG